jgi:hypothetical protein
MGFRAPKSFTFNGYEGVKVLDLAEGRDVQVVKALSSHVEDVDKLVRRP